MRYLPLREARAVTGLCGNTLRKYADSGRIPCFRLPNGDRRFDVSAFVEQQRHVIGYARVSTRKQTEDLQRQADFLHLKYPGAEIVKDIGFFGWLAQKKLYLSHLIRFKVLRLKIILFFMEN
jgi:predicted site-specific integrase-resolvase